MMETSMMNAMCRCCASEGVFKDVKSTYHWMGEEEIYADMLKECFDLTLFTPDDGEDGGICEVCITQLRNAVNFKKQVLHTEDQFKKHVQNKLFKPNIVKVELEGEDGESDDNNASAEEGYSGTEYEIPIKTEVPEEPKPKKRAAAAKATTSRAKKAKIEVGEPSTKRDEDNVAFLEINVEPKKVVKKAVAKKEKPVLKKRMKEIHKHRHNLTEILTNTNATPILRHGRIGYMCNCCMQEFPEPGDLKKHTLESHKAVANKSSFFKNSTMYEYYIKLDITALKCNICNKNIQSLEEILDHLKNVHEKTMYLDIKNHIVPFKFESEQLTCCLCPTSFDKFKVLQEHMHKHYRNYICDVCESGYVNQGCLARHKYIHKLGTFPCEYCPKIFDTKVKKIMHQRSNHTHKHSMIKCGYCDAGFRDLYLKEAHLTEVHGIKPRENKCNACGKCFLTPMKLRVHTQRHHLLLRRHKCTQCDMEFYDSGELKRHMVTHTGLKEFKCELCFTSFSRKFYLNQHMRKHERGQ